MSVSGYRGGLSQRGCCHTRPKCQLPLQSQLSTPILSDTDTWADTDEPQQKHPTHWRGKEINILFFQKLLSCFQFSYYGEGLDKGQCGVTINSVEDKYNGIVRCFLGLPSEVQEPSGAFLLTVASTFLSITR